MLFRSGVALDELFVGVDPAQLQDGVAHCRLHQHREVAPGVDVPVRKTVIAVDAGRNLAVLVEAAVRNTILQLRGIDTYKEFIERHNKAMLKPE